MRVIKLPAFFDNLIGYGEAIFVVGELRAGTEPAICVAEPLEIQLSGIQGGVIIGVDFGIDKLFRNILHVGFMF